jgi:hypothetical protein
MYIIYLPSISVYVYFMFFSNLLYWCLRFVIWLLDSVYVTGYNIICVKLTPLHFVRRQRWNQSGWQHCFLAVFFFFFFCSYELYGVVVFSVTPSTGLVVPTCCIRALWSDRLSGNLVVEIFIVHWTLCWGRFILYIMYSCGCIVIWLVVKSLLSMSSVIVTIQVVKWQVYLFMSYFFFFVARVYEYTSLGMTILFIFFFISLKYCCFVLFWIVYLLLYYVIMYVVD